MYTLLLAAFAIRQQRRVNETESCTKPKIFTYAKPKIFALHAPLRKNMPTPIRHQKEMYLQVRHSQSFKTILFQDRIFTYIMHFK